MAAEARQVALDVLDRVLGRRQPFDETFAGHPHVGELTSRDRAFARLLVTTVLRRLGQIDAVLDAFVRRRPKELRVRNLLRLGTAQLLFLDTPAHAAVGETVALARGPEGFAKGLANAVLRRVAGEGRDVLAGQDALRLNTPAWLYGSWVEAFGAAAAEAIATAHLGEPPLDLAMRDDPGTWGTKLGARPLVGRTMRLSAHGPIEALPGYAEGAFWVQDVAASLPARLLGEVRGETVLDLCAAPGGKTAQLAAAGARVVALEVSPKRAERLRANLARLRLAADVVVADVLDWRPAEPARFVLLDAPCSATGTIRRHPDIPWTKSPDDVARMADLQHRLLAAAAAMLAPDGTLVYASCSLQPEEGQDVVRQALEAAPTLERSPISPAELDLPVDLTSAGEVRTLPCHLAEAGGMDGFFIARLRRPARAASQSANRE